MKKLEEVLIKTKGQKQINDADVRAVKLKIVKWILNAAKKLLFWMNVNLKVSSCNLFN